VIEMFPFERHPRLNKKLVMQLHYSLSFLHTFLLQLGEVFRGQNSALSSIKERFRGRIFKKHGATEYVIFP